MPLNNGERQVAPTLDGIRRDHIARYEWAAKRVTDKGGGFHVIDVACGIGYGTRMLAEAGAYVWGHDRDPDAIEYAKAHYAHERASFAVADASEPIGGERDLAVCFETIEHIEDPAQMLRALRIAPVLLASVPNEDVFPHGGRIIHHFRHYTKGQFQSLLERAGWAVREWWGQEGPESEVERDIEGRTIIAVCDRGPIPDAVASERSEAELVNEAFGVPEHVAILGLGPSLSQYVEITKRLGGKHAYCDETWGINALGGVLMCDRIFHMDDVRIQELRAKAQPESNIAKMLEWLKVHPGPVITSRKHADYPGLVEFPLEQVLGRFEFDYFNSTAAYALAYAIYLGVKRISLFGVDFTYPKAHDAEKGRACVEFWLGVAAARGIKLTIAKTSSLMDACHSRRERLYGYDTVDIAIAYGAGGRTKVEMTERDQAKWPSAEEIEDRYDHAKHPNALVDDD